MTSFRRSRSAPPARKEREMSRYKAVLIGINYYANPRNALKGCVNDILNSFRELVRFNCGYDVTILSDENPNTLYASLVEILQDEFTKQDYYGVATTEKKLNIQVKMGAKATKRNILASLETMVSESVRGDKLFVHYAGHGTSQRDMDGDEADGKDEALVSEDMQLILDDELYSKVLTRVRDGVSFFSLMDCCHSGTIFDLPWGVIVNHERASWVHEFSRVPKNKPVEGVIVMISGCKDDQTSADATLYGSQVPPGFDGSYSGGAFSTFLLKEHRRNPRQSLAALLESTRKSLKMNGYSQIPCLSCNVRADLSAPLRLN